MIPKTAYDEAYNLRVKKAQDYNGGTVRQKDYNPFGHKSYVDKINSKNLRLVSLVGSGNVPEHESLRDTLVDLINYAAIYIDAIDNGDVD